MSAPLFRAITKDGPVPPADAKGTLTAFWNKKGNMAEDPEADVKEQIDAVPAPNHDSSIENGEAAQKESISEEKEQTAAKTPQDNIAVTAVADTTPSPAEQQAAEEPLQTEDLKVQAEDKAPTAADKKRKRGPESRLTADQLEALATSFASSEYPNKQQKLALAEKLGIELPSVSKWFEKQRRKQRDAQGGGANKRGKSAAAAGKAAAEEEKTTKAAADQTEPQVEQEQAMEIDLTKGDGDDDDDDHTESGAKAQQMEEEKVMEDKEAASPQAMDVDIDVASTPAAEIKAPATVARADPAPATQEVDAQPEQPTAAEPAAPVAAAPAQEAKVYTLEELATKRTELAGEIQSLRASGLAAPLKPLTSPSSRIPFNDAALAAHVAGQCMTLQELITTLLPFFASPDAADQPVSEDLMRNRIVDLATRKSHGQKAGKLTLDPLTDTSEEALWQWELRDPKVLPKEERAEAQVIKRRAACLSSRLNAVEGALKAVVAYKEGASTAKITKALETVAKAKTLDQFDAEVQADREAAAAKAAAKKSQGSGKPALTQEEKDRLKAEKEAEKERLKAEKEAEKERLKAEKEAQKEREKAEKEALKEKERLEKEAVKEKERLEKEALREKERLEKEAERKRKAEEQEKQKLSKKTGFKDVVTLQKSQNKFKSFFKAKATAASPAAGSPQQGQGPTPGQDAARDTDQGAAAAAAGGPSTGGTPAPTTAKKAIKGYTDLFPKPSADTLAPFPTQPVKDDAIDAGLAAGVSPEDALAQWKASLQQAKEAEIAAREHKRKHLIGLPPSWSRGSGGVEAAAERTQRMKEDGVDVTQVKVWRRKMLNFPADSKRPAFYGSWTRHTTAVRRRRYLGKDETLDYEVMSDLDWEEEPEGSSLSGADSDSEAGAAVEEQSELEDSFMVADGYLSEDEGVQLEDEADSVDPMDTCLVGADGAAAHGDDGTAAAPEKSVLERKAGAVAALMERARRSGKPLIISAMAEAVNEQEGSASVGGCITGDAALLEAFSMEVLLPAVRICPPALPGSETAVAAGGEGAAGAAPGSAAAPGATGEGKGPGRKFERPEELVPDLARFIKANFKLTRPKMVDGFLEAHPGRPIPKKWVNEKLSELAERRGGTSGWVLKPATVAMLEGGPMPAAAAAGGGGGGAPMQIDDGAPAAGGGAAGGLCATPAEVGNIAANPLTKMLFKTTPAVPNALRPNAPPSDLKAPSRLVTNTTSAPSPTGDVVMAEAQQAQQRERLVLDMLSGGLTDPFWQNLLQSIEDADSQNVATDFMAAFTEGTLARNVACLPAFVVSALVSGLARNMQSIPLRTAFAASLKASVDALAAAAKRTGDEGEEELNLSQKVWAENRAAPIAASLTELSREPHLLQALGQCMTSQAECLAAAKDSLAIVIGMSECTEAAACLVQQQEVLAAGLEACALETGLQATVQQAQQLIENLGAAAVTSN